MADKQVTKRSTQVAESPAGTEVQNAHAPQTGSTLVPDVDIYEDGDRIHLLADMPGVDPASIEVTVENAVLTIQGQARVEAPEGYELAGQEYAVGRFRRDFTLSDAVDTGAVKARVRHGVLELTIPKREEMKVRKIEIEA